MMPRETYRFGPFELDADERRLIREGDDVPIQPRVLDTLLYLIRNGGRLVPKQELLDHVWEGAHVTENVLTRCVRQARQALGDDARKPKFIATVPRSGYRFEAEVTGPERSTEPHGQVRSIAVLPFRPISPEQRDESLELGMADTLISRLSNVRRLTVRPLSAVRRYTALDDDAIEAGREQGVDAVLEGSIQRTDEKLRVTARLLRTSDSSAIWSGRFDEAMADVFTLQDAIAERILEAMSVRISGPERERLGLRTTSDPDAYQAYLLGRFHWSQHTAAGARDAIRYFHAALESDPGYTLPHVGLAEAWISLGTLGTRPREFYPRARESALRALELDPNLPEALSALGSIAWQFDWDHETAEELFERSIELNGNLADSRIAYSDFRAFSGDVAGALEQGERARELDPVSPNVNSLLAQAYYFGRRWEEAERQLFRALEIDPEFGFAEFFLACVALAKGEVESAVQRLERVRQISDRLDFVGVLGVAYGRSGRIDELRALLDEVSAIAESEPVPAILLAMLHHGLGDHAATYRWLRRMVDDRSWHIHILYSDPMLEDLRNEPEARAILREAGFS